jgi:hypothetical protein
MLSLFPLEYFASGMERRERHLSPDLIKGFAYGLDLLDRDELLHFQECDQCCEAWWRFKLQLKRERDENLRIRDKTA